VSITIKGSKAKLPKRHLTKKGTQKKVLPFRFNKGTMNVFKFSEKDIGDVVSIIVEVFIAHFNKKKLFLN